MRFLHSRQYITTDKIGSLSISADQKTIYDGNHNKIIGLVNIPYNKNYYSLEIDASEQKHQPHNIKIMINVNFTKLYSIVKRGKVIPNKTELVALINRNQEVPNIMDITGLAPLNYKKELRLYTANIVYLDTININLDTNVFSLKPPTMIDIDPNRILLIGSYNYNELGRNSLVVYDKYRPNNIPDKVMTIQKKQLNSIINKKWDIVVFIDIEDETFVSSIISARHRKFIYSKLTDDTLHKVLNIFLETDVVSYDNIYNINVLRQFIVRLKPPKKIKRKSMKLSIFERRYMDEIDLMKLNKYKSFPNNFIHHNFITKTDFAKRNRGNGRQTCSICLDIIVINNIAFTDCDHYFCKKCIYANLNISNSCPNCRTKIKTGSIHTIGKYVYNNSKLLYILEKIKQSKPLLIFSDYAETLHNLQVIIKKQYGSVGKSKFSKLDAITTKSFQRNITAPHEVIFMDTANVNFSYYFNTLTTLLYEFDNYKMLVYD
jgi:hypothetical protein